MYLAFKGVASKSTIHRIIARSKENNNVIAKSRPGRTVEKANAKNLEKVKKIVDGRTMFLTGSPPREWVGLGVIYRK